jgi:murein L,D-transpeptidase YafK
MRHIVIGTIAGLGFATLVAACSGGPEIAPAQRPLTKATLMQLGKKGMKPEAPLFVRIFKEESELEIWKQRDDGRFYHFKTYPICTWSGELGPKIAQGDKQAPEGFYTVSKAQMNPNSSFHLAFNLGYPNAYDKAHGRTGSALMVHGKCKSAGCYAMTDALIEEIYALAREAFDAGHASFQVHAYPFRMTDENMARHKGARWHGFWQVMKEGHDYFETVRVPPPVVVCGRRYHVNARPLRNASMRLDPAGQCPALERMPIEPFQQGPDQQVASAPLMAPGPKMRTVAAATPPTGAAATSGATAGTAPASGGGIASMLKGALGGSASGLGFTGPSPSD